jgi:hypothetical protein
MRVVRDGKGSFVGVLLPGAENAVVCGECGFLFKPNSPFSGALREKCPAFGHPGPFRRATEADIAAYFESRRIRPIHYLQAAGLFVIIGAIVALIVWALG